jgi:hypothetical protein
MPIDLSAAGPAYLLNFGEGSQGQRLGRQPPLAQLGFTLTAILSPHPYSDPAVATQLDRPPKLTPGRLAAIGMFQPLKHSMPRATTAERHLAVGEVTRPSTTTWLLDA